MYTYVSDSIVSMCLYVSILNIQIYIPKNLVSVRFGVGTVGRSDTSSPADGCSRPRIFLGVLFIFGTYLTVDCSVPSPGLSRHFSFECWTKQKITYMHMHTHTTSYIHIQAYTYIYMHDTIIYIHMIICECM
jgi:hypothetical protein